MRTLAADESLSEETRESAQNALDELVMAQIEREKEVRKQKAEAKRIAQKLEADKESLLASLEASRFEETKETQLQTTKEMAEWLARHRLSRFSENILRVAGMYVSKPRAWGCG